MPSFNDFASSQVTKMLLVGDSGSGKTGALMSLIAAGYNVRILDLDAGVAVLNDYLKNPNSIYTRPFPGLWTAEQAKTLLTRVCYETVTDKMRNVNGKLVPKQATVWQRAAKLLDGWPEFGPISSWTPQDVLVIDSLTFLCNGALNFVLMMNGRLGQQPHQSDWYQAQQLVEALLQMLYDDNVGCNVIVNCHVVLIGEENGPQRAYPASLGKALSPKIGRYFNTVLMAKTVGTGTAAKHKILTQSANGLELKTTVPLKAKAEYDLATGLAEYFAAERQQDAPAAVAATGRPSP
jgi:hypothetical protein